MASVSAKPWLKHYDVGGQGLIILPESIKPYPREPLFSILDKSAAAYPDNHAIHFKDKTFTYKQLKEMADKIAHALADLGVKRGDCVSTYLINSPQFVISDFGILKTGATHVPCSTLHKGDELLREVQGSGAETLICMDSTLDVVNQIKDQTQLKRIIVTSLDDLVNDNQEPVKIPGTIHFLDLLTKYSPEPPQVNIDPVEDVAELIFTGGTTGDPKGVMLTHASKLANLAHMTWALGPVADMVRGALSWLVAVPLFHQMGMTITHLCISMGFETYIVADPRDINTIAKILKENQPNACSCVPTQYAKLLEMDLGKLTTSFTSSTSPLRSELTSKFKEATGAEIGDSYGATECGGGTHANIASSDLVTEKKPGSIGVPFPDTEVKIVDPSTGKEIDSGEEGELWVRGPQIMKGYWPTPGSGLIDGWLPMGDIVKMDEDGYFYITDRIKDMANVSGMKVYTILVDKVLYEHPGVDMAAAIAVPDPERPGSDRVKAYIKLKEEYKDKVTEKEIIDLCKEKLSAYSVPKYVEFRDDLPINPLGKIMKRKLRDEEIAKSK
ncbi:MAG: AMP-binding protein [Dehalococcoidia bacterium]|nr:AMP-binding protein [Dehalococcoidia bacterium]